MSLQHIVKCRSIAHISNYFSASESMELWHYINHSISIISIKVEECCSLWQAVCLSLLETCVLVHMNMQISLIGSFFLHPHEGALLL